MGAEVFDVCRAESSPTSFDRAEMMMMKKQEQLCALPALDAFLLLLEVDVVAVDSPVVA